jgi:hypothetical protein
MNAMLAAAARTPKHCRARSATRAATRTAGVSVDTTLGGMTTRAF